MRKFSIDTNLRVRLFHQPGQLARLAAAIAEQGSLMGEIAIVSIDEHHTVRDVAIETSDDEHTRRVIGAVKALDGIELLAITDWVFERHQGGKIRSGGRVKVEQVWTCGTSTRPGWHGWRRPSSGSPRWPGTSPPWASRWGSSPTAPGCWGSATSARWPACR